MRTTYRFSREFKPLLGCTGEPYFTNLEELIGHLEVNHAGDPSDCALLEAGPQHLEYVDE